MGEGNEAAFSGSIPHRLVGKEGLTMMEVIDEGGTESLACCHHACERLPIKRYVSYCAHRNSPEVGEARKKST